MTNPNLLPPEYYDPAAGCKGIMVGVTITVIAAIIVLLILSSGRIP